MDSDERKRPHAVCIPFPAQGHITPFLHLAKLLHTLHGFYITFVNTEYNHRRLLRSQGSAALAGIPGFNFRTIPDGLPPTDDFETTQDIPSLCASTSKNCLAPLRSLLKELNSSSDSGLPPVTCMVTDGAMTFALDAAAELGVPAPVFWTASACSFMCYLHYQELIDRDIFPLKNEEDLFNGYLDTPIEWVPGMKHTRLRDFPSFIRTTNADDIMVNFVNREVHRDRLLASGVIFNTFEDLEHEVVEALRKFLPPVFPTGPLHLVSKHITDSPVISLGSNLWTEDNQCFEWLRGRKPSSVVYVNFGSITVMTNDQLVEFAWGLANSGHDFLWVIRSDLVAGDTAVLPQEFSEVTKTRGLLASWCNQDEVLANPAVGVFLTHNGWNSTLESLSHGVPMISWPFFADQQTNSRYACKEWHVSKEIDNNVRREEVTQLIRDAMEGENAAEMKKRAVEWKEKSCRAAEHDGAALKNLERLVNEVLLSKKI